MPRGSCVSTPQSNSLRPQDTRRILPADRPGAHRRRLGAHDTPEEIADALWMIDSCERWNMPRNEADAWRLRILARQWFLELGGNTTADA